MSLSCISKPSSTAELSFQHSQACLLMKASICQTDGRSKTCISALATAVKKNFVRAEKNDFVIKMWGGKSEILYFGEKSRFLVKQQFVFLAVTLWINLG